jgi:hypothetical protein
METCFVSRWGKELMDLKRYDVRRLVAKGVIGLQVQKYRRQEEMYTSITIFHLLVYVFITSVRKYLS